MQTVGRSVLYVNAEDFDAESDARRDADRDGGFISAASVAERLLQGMRLPVERGAPLGGGRDRVLWNVRRLPARQRVGAARRKEVARRLGRTARGARTRRETVAGPATTETARPVGSGSTISPTFDVPVAGIAGHVAALHRAMAGRSGRP